MNVFIGSTSEDLKEYRQAAIDVCIGLKLTPLAMEHFNAMGAGAVVGSKRKIDEAHVYVGVFAHRYGYIEEGYPASVTEIEFDYAGERGLDRLCFLVDPKYPWSPEFWDAQHTAPLAAFKARVEKSLIRRVFTTVDDFRFKLQGSLVEWMDSNKEGIRVEVPQPSMQRLHQLPTQRGFVAREKELGELRQAVTHGGVTMFGLQGMGGVGKTALALKLAHEFKAQYPDAQIYLDLKGVTAQPLTPFAIMWHVISSFEPEQKRPDDAALPGWYQSILEGKHALLFYDNAADASQVASVLPPETCLLLVTSRKRFTLPGMWEKNLDEMTLSDAMDLLIEIAPRIGTHAEGLSKQCGCLPLALSAAASALRVNRSLSVEEYMRRLKDQKTQLQLHDPVTNRTVDACFGLSYELLGEEQQKRWRTLAVFPADFDAPAAAAVWGSDLDSAKDSLNALDAYSLMDWDEATGRYSLHDLGRAFGDSRRGPEEREAAAEGHASHYVEILSLADQLYLKGGTSTIEGLSLFDQEFPNIESGQKWAAGLAEVSDSAARLCSSYGAAGAYVLDLRQDPREGVGWLESALRAATRIGDRRNEANHLGNLGNRYVNLGEVRKAVDYYEEALAISWEIGDRSGEGIRLGNLGNAYAVLGEVRKAVECYEKALMISREIGDRRGEGSILGNLGSASEYLGDVGKAVEYHEKALAISREIGDRRVEGNALRHLGVASAALGEVGKAVEYHEKALAISQEIGDRSGEGNALGNLGLAYAKLGDVRKAVDYYQKALGISQEIGDRSGEGTWLAHLGNECARLGDKVRAKEHMTAALGIFTELESPDAAVMRQWLTGLENGRT